MLKGIKIKIYPNNEQTNYLNCLLGCTRLVYNTALDWKKLESDKQQWAEAHPKSGMVGFNNKPNISFNFGSLREVQEIQNRVINC